MHAPLVYLAGFDVFRTDAVEHGRYLKALCAAHGLEGLYPFDNEVTHGRTAHETAQQIYSMNVAMIHRCTAMLVNLNVFRGLEPDSGTAFEVGMAVALNKPVWAYFEPVASLRDLVPHDENGLDANGFAVEDFDLPRNLMLGCSWAGTSSTVELGAEALAKYLSGFQALPASG
ncbi:MULTISPECIES: nucleoside 2-deoxyribosyltransferase [Pseudomonas syringae group]|uniref:nucleoside 2-deoxyribosyltransferase n=1 Tax=Pseudomonas syringae group TaxID=136849 RepID=UPI000EFF1971|nr:MULTISPECIES: nucleoside 2-deoxyribosyltransferase [Pseudomonas syringae group]RMM57624.1 Nucleoside 2-deoxyribosyltransferase [Pseudomonas syringae pv. atrofaciens]RMU59292.1 Nucleoside 2-deoxyribosyltransferase [Pseudomonas syringae pv. syringae]